MTHERFEELHLVSINGKIHKSLFISEVGAWYTRDKYHPIHVQSEAHIQQICNGNDMIYW